MQSRAREGEACLGLLWDVTPLVSLCVCEDVSFWSVTLGIGEKSGRRVRNICTFKGIFLFVLFIGFQLQRLT